MRILNRKQFLAEPLGTVFFDYKPTGFYGRPSVKVDEPGYMENDFCRIEIEPGMNISRRGSNESAFDTGEFVQFTEAAEAGERIDVIYDASSRDGCFEEDALFAVLDDDDVERLIALLVNRKVKT